MTAAELERHAYITGDPMAGIYADLDDAESRINGFDDELDAARKEGFMAGEISDAATYLEAQLDTAKKAYKIARTNLEGVARWFELGDERLKTAKGRKDCATQLRHAMLNLPREVQQ